MRILYYALPICLLIALPLQAQTTVTLTPSKDNTIYESSSGSLSNGAGSYLFAGTTGTGGATASRRALIAFDLSSIPAGSRVQSVVLRLSMSRTISGSHQVDLHRVTSDWGEGTSKAVGGGGGEGNGGAATTNDATWIHTFFDSGRWNVSGGDFAGASAGTPVGGIGVYTWGSNTAMVADVQGWIDEPQNNFGWILIGNESAASTAKRFDSRENAISGNRPQLQITYSTGVGVEDEVPATLALSANFPNPFTVSTSIPLEVDAVRRVKLEVYDVLGRLVSVPVDGMLTPGLHTFEVSAGSLPSGAYSYCLQDESGRSCRSMILTR